ncbi:phosphoribosylformylglycinamidine synthase [Bacteroidota bacterium]
MILFYRAQEGKVFVVDSRISLSDDNKKKLTWLFGGTELSDSESILGMFIGPRKEMITPWSTNAVEITRNMGIDGIERIEEFLNIEGADIQFDPMLQDRYDRLSQNIFTIIHEPEPVRYIEDIGAYNAEEGLALSTDEIEYLESVSERMDRKLTDSEVFGFSQVNSEHCRHKIFNGTFIIDDEEKEESLFDLIRKTSKVHPDNLVSAYKDNVAFLKGPIIEQFAPESQNKPDYFITKDIDSIISLKAETHNFPTTVEPFNGASTGTGGEIRDRMAGGKASIPMAGTAVYMTAYSHLEGNRLWEKNINPRKWLYQTPIDILIKASNGASDFGNKFGQPLICGSILTFEHEEHNLKFGYDKVIMLAGGIGFGKNKESGKGHPKKGDKIILMGGDNYRIGMGGGAVSSVATGEYANAIELNAVQRANPEMQKRVYNAIRAMSETDTNPVISIHDHGAGGHLNCFSELVEETGGTIDLNELPVGDPTLSSKEIVGNESQERMGLIIKEKDLKYLAETAERERAPLFKVGEISGDMNFRFEDKKTGRNPIDWPLEFMFGKPPKTVLSDKTRDLEFRDIEYDRNQIQYYLEQVLQLEAVACKDWLTNKVDRSVTGKIAKQQTAGKLQLPLNNVGVVALDYQGKKGIATSIGHAPVSGLIDSSKGSILSVAEALTNIVWAPIEGKLQNVSLSANWMWPSKNPGEDSRLYRAVKAISDFAIEIGVNIPTGKDSLSMTQKYKDGNVVYAPGTVIISAAGEVSDIRKVVEPVLQPMETSSIYYINISDDNFKLGGSSFAQIFNKLGFEAPSVTDPQLFSRTFNAIQDLIKDNMILSGHDIGSGGLITTLLEMVFTDNSTGAIFNLSELGDDLIRILFSEQPGLIIQSSNQEDVEELFEGNGIKFVKIGQTSSMREFRIEFHGETLDFDIDSLRDIWFNTSYLLDTHQTKPELARERFESYKKHNLEFNFNDNFTGKFSQYDIDPNRKSRTGLKAAIIREKGVNGDREMAYVMHLAGFDVKDVHMTDLIAGRETLEDIHFIVFVGGFSNSDVLGSAKGWAGAFLFNPAAKKALDNFYAREDTLSLGICNGCQLVIELGLIYPDMAEKPRMLHNDSGKFESGFLNMEIFPNQSVMFNSLAGSRLGVWVAHGEGKFHLSGHETDYHIPGKFVTSTYPVNPNGSDFNAACIASDNGRHVAMMPHLERAFFPWQWGYYPVERKNDDVTPWIEAFVNAREWVKAKI